MRSIGEMIQDLVEYQFRADDLGEWADNFITSISQKTDSGRRTIDLTEKQTDKINELHVKYIGGLKENGRPF